VSLVAVQVNRDECPWTMSYLIGSSSKYIIKFIFAHFSVFFKHKNSSLEKTKNVHKIIMVEITNLCKGDGLNKSAIFFKI